MSTQTIWRTIKLFSGNTTNTQPIKSLKKSDGNLTMSNEEIVEILASQFSKISSDSSYSTKFINEKEKIMCDNYSSPQISKSARQIEENITKFELDTVMKVKKDNSPGPDRILYSMIRKGPEILKERLLNLFDEIFSTGTIPHDWKKQTLFVYQNLLKAKSTQNPIDPYC